MKMKHLFNLALSALLVSASFQSCKKDYLASKKDRELSSISALKDGISTMSVPEPCIQRCLVAGKNMTVGTVDVAVNGGGDLLITYNITVPNVYLLETHADIFSSLEQFKQEKKLSNGGATPGKFNFKKAFDPKAKATSYTVVVPKSYVDKYGSSGCVSIATHAALSNGETAWAGICSDTPKSTSLQNAQQFPGKNWSVYFDFCLNECKGKDFTYAWEDLRNEGNDADYNDLIIQTDAIRNGNELKLKFFATARGAGFDHVFKIKIPKQGIISIQGANSEAAPAYTSDGLNYIITVFASTKVALPTNDVLPHTNTFPYLDCVPYGTKDIVLKVDNSFKYNTSKPYEPFLTVYPSGEAGVGENYDLSIFELTGQHTWSSPDGKIYPNGILIPKDWSWPVEQQHITGPYPEFPQANWAANLANPALTYDKDKCK